MEVRHLNHSCLLVTMAGTRILVDPGGFSVEKIKEFGPITGLDAVLITHQHPDHIHPGLLTHILTDNPDIPVIAEPETAAILTTEDETDSPAAGHPIIELAAGDIHEVRNVTIRGYGGLHAVIHPDIPRVGNTGIVLEAIGEPRLGITGDSLEPIDAFRRIDVLAFAVVAPWSKMEETINFLRDVKPRLALPVHDAIASPYGRPIFFNQSKNFAPKETEVRDWPEDDVVVVGGRKAPEAGCPVRQDSPKNFS